MASSNESKLCVVCKKAVKSTEIVLVCGLWCRKFFHNKCVGLSNSEARAVTCRKKLIKFHCEACEKRLRIELLGGKETHEPNKLQNCVYNCVDLSEIVQNLLKLTNKISNDNLTINTKLEKVLTCSARLEEYLLQSARCLGKLNEDAPDNNVEYVEGDSTNQITESREHYDRNSQNRSANRKKIICRESDASSQQQEVEDNSSPHITSDFPKQVPDSQQQNSAEGCSSNCLQEWGVPDGHDSTQDPLRIRREECSPLEDFPMNSTFSFVKTEGVDDEEKSLCEDYGEAYPPSEDFLRPSTFNTEKTGDEEDEEAVSEDDLQDLKQEVELTNNGSGPESTNAVGMEDETLIDDSGGLVTSVSLATETGNKIQCTTTQETSCKSKFGMRHRRRKRGVWKKSSAIPIGVEDDHINGSRSLVSSVSLAERTGNRIKCTSIHETPFVNKFGTRYLKHKCVICKKMFAQFQGLMEHAHTCKRELLQSCNVCHKTFATSSGLKEHYRLHTGERPYSCGVCNKTFIRSHHLKQHSRLHTGERPYSCGICNETFTQNTQLMRHLRWHTDERP